MQPDARRRGPARAPWLCLLLPPLLALAGCKATIVEPTLPPAWPESAAQRPLTRADCISLAAGSAPTAAAWEARRLAARARLDQASRLPNPTLSLGWEDFGLNQAATGSTVQSTLSLALALADVAARKRRKHAAQAELLAEEADLRAERAQLAADVCLAYDELVVARARAALHAELTDVAGMQAHDVGRFVENGLLPRLDLERAVAEGRQAQADFVGASTRARALELEFAFALGFERPVALALAEPLAAGGNAGAGGTVSSLPLAELLAVAAAARPELAAARARYEAERERLSLAAERVQFMPTIGAGPRTLGDEVLGVASIDVELSLFDSGAVAEHEQQAALLGAASALRAAAHAVALQVCTTLGRSQAAEAFIRDHARDLAARRRGLRERTERLFHDGEAEFADLVLARRDEVQSRVALLDAEHAAAAARVALQAALGVFAADDPVP